MAVLQPIWTRIPEYSHSAPWPGRADFGLLRRKGMADRGKSQVAHHRALAYKQFNAAMTKLAEKQGAAALAVRFLIVTAARSSEVRGATWSEVDLEQKVWTVPAERMKAGKEHRVPLSDESLQVLGAAKTISNAAGTPYMFPGGRKRRPLTDVALSKALHFAAGKECTVHGLRSMFRDWCGEATTHAGDVAEAALAHTVRDKVEAAYRRGDLFEKRRRLMDDWGVFTSPRGHG
jgi:integrase